MRHLRQAALIAVSSITVVACLPNRDNGADPSIRPAAVLSVASGGFIPYGASGDDGDGDGCVDVPDTFSPVITRAKCVHLSAVGSSDPQGAETLVEYRFALVTTSASESAPLEDDQIIVSAVGTALSVVFRAPNLRQQDPGGYQARLEVIDRDGHSNVTLTSLSVENSRPIAVPPSPRFVTSWGAAWTTDGSLDFSVLRPLTIHFSADGSFDPDGDPLNYCWRDRTNQVELGCQTDPEIAVSPEPIESSGKLVLELRVDDVFSQSQPVLATAVLDAEPGWAFENDTASVKVLDERRSSFLLDSNDMGIPKFREALALQVAPNLLNSLLYFKSGSETTIARRAIGQMCADTTVCGSAPLVSVTFPPSVARVTNLVRAGTSPFVWTVSTNVDGSTRIDAVRDEATLTIAATAGAQGSFFTDNESFARVDKMGRLWTGSPFSSAVTCFEYSPLPAPAISECGSISLSAGYVLSGLALRDLGAAGEEVWAMQSRDFLSGTVGPPSAKVMTTLGTVETIRVNSDELAFEADLAFSLEFVDRNLSWLNLFGEGLASVELCNPDPAAEPPGDGPIAASTELCIRSVAPFEASFETLSDSATGTFVALGLEGHSLNRMTLGGKPSHIASPERIETLLHVDATSGIWSVIENGGGVFVLSRGKGSGKDGLILTESVGTSFVAPVLDAGSGDVWVSTLFPPGAVRYSPDGSRTDLVTAILATTSGATPVPLVLPGGVLPDPQRGHVWVVGNIDPSRGGGTQLFLFDPNARRKPSAPSIAPGVPGLTVPLIDSATLAQTGEVITDAAVHVQSGDLIVLTATTAGLTGSTAGPCQPQPPALPQANNYYLRRIEAANGGGGGFVDAPLCVVDGYVQENGDTPVRLARDLSSGDVCIGFRESPTTVRMRRYQNGTTLESDDSIATTNSDPITDVAADPLNCWMSGSGDGSNERAWVLLPGFGSNAMIQLRAETATGTPIDLPKSSTIHPVVELAEVRAQSAATRVWLGGDGSPITLYLFPNPANPGRIDPRALPLSSDFEMTFVKH